MQHAGAVDQRVREGPARAAVSPPTRSGPAARAAPWVLAAAVVALQIAYPLVLGDVRDAVTVGVVATFAAASLVHAAVARGWLFAALVAAVAFGGGLAVEVLGVATGFPFGTYVYGGRLGPSVLRVPLVIPLAWTMMAYPSLLVGLRLARTAWGVAVCSGAALAAWDLFLDPQMVAEGHWTWAPSPGPHLYGTIPVQNFVAWFVVAALMAAGLHAVLRRRTRATADVDDRAPLALYVWTWAASTLAHAVFFDLPESALIGGCAMGAFVAALWVRGRRRPPAAARA